MRMDLSAVDASSMDNNLFSPKPHPVDLYNDLIYLYTEQRYHCLGKVFCSTSEIDEYVNALSLHKVPLLQTEACTLRDTLARFRTHLLLKETREGWITVDATSECTASAEEGEHF